jgi:quinol monooxygenase YgiN
MIIVAGTVRIDPAKIDIARVEMDKMIAASRAEDGCLEYGYAIDVLDPRVAHVFEVWRDREALECHFKTAHIAAWRAMWSAIGVSDRKLKIYEVERTAPI